MSGQLSGVGEHRWTIQPGPWVPAQHGGTDARRDMADRVGHGRSVVYPTGSVVPFDTLAGVVPTASAPPAAPEPPTETGSLRADADRLEQVFAAAYAARDVDGCVGAVLDLEQ